MRLSSLLPMLLLLVSPLAAQNCNIFDLTASAVQFDPLTCQFFVVLDFQHTANSNQFTVNGNGTNYGTYEYGQVPLTIGPLTASPNGPSTFEFVVRDAVFQDCFDVATIDVAACGVNGNCDIFDLSVDVGDCHPLLGTYNATVNFSVTNPGNGFFELWAGNNVHLGTFPLASLPLTIPNFPWGGGAFDVLKVCINDQVNCCETIEFNAPTCFTQGCGLFDLSVNTGDCTSDSTYKALVNFHLLNPGAILPDSFRLLLNGTQFGVYGLNQLPLPVVFETTGNPTSVVSVCTTFPTGAVCCIEKVFEEPVCVAPCAIQNLNVEVDSCTSDSTFGLWVNFHVADTSAVDSFSLSGNGQLLGHFGLNQLPLHIDNFEWNGLIFNSIRVCTGNEPACCKELSFLAPDCLPFGPCEVTNIFVKTGDCTSDSTYKVNLFFNATNPGNGTFVVRANGTLLDTFNLTDVPLMIPNFPWNGGTNDVVTICVLDSIDQNVPPTECCKSLEFAVPSCLLPCNISDFNVMVGDCNPAGGYGIKINFNATNPGNDSFDVYANGNLIGTFPLSQLPLTIPNFPASGNNIDVVKVCINDQPNCCVTKEFEAPNCNPDCHITDFNVLVGDCDSTGHAYSIKIDFNVSNPGNDFFDVYANGTLFGTYPINQLPLTIPNFPASGNNIDVVKVCINDQPNCCVIKEFEAPNCNPDCHIFDLNVQVGDCNPAGGYHITINFGVTNPGNDFFEVYANGTLFGTYPLNQLPLHIPNFPASGNNFDVVKVCINDQPNCCIIKEFQAPNCNPDCHIFDLSVQVGDCDSTGNAYALTINFNVTNPGNDFFNVYTDGGVLIGTYPLNQLPLTIPNFPASGNNIDLVKVCINDHPNCCITKEFEAPNCNPDCHIFDLSVQVGDCNPAGGYHITINFGVTNPGNDFFDVYANGTLFGTYPLNQLPLHIPNFPASGNNFDVVKVCINDQPNCCIIKEFQAPNCGQCEITNLHVDTGDCNADSTYNLNLNFQVVNSNATQFVVFGNGINLGTFNISQLPLHISNFPWDGQGPNDVIKVCTVGDPNTVTCCKIIEFPIPDCLQGGGDCNITDLHVVTGVCTGDSTYVVTVNFQVANPPSNTFALWANGQFFGMYGIGQVPLVIQNFPWNGGNNDVIKVCFGTPGTVPTCCAEVEYAVPACLTSNGDCEITNLIVDTGDCTSDSTYNMFVNFQAVNPIGNTFTVGINGVIFGTYNLNQLPLSLQNVHWNGGNNDVIKVCFVTPNGATGCCKTLEYAVPDCLGNTGDCEIVGLVVDPGTCTSDSTYSLFLNFQVVNQPGTVFGVWANGVFQGTFNLNQLPLNFPNFPWNGGPNDVIKVCFLDNSGTASCCKSLEFAVPDCLGGNQDCHIWDVLAVRTGCLCGQFFVALTFNHDNGSASGFDVVGNGNNYGTFPYNTQQPIILGPFTGDGTTSFEFGVVDHENGDCHDGFNLGEVECSTPVVEPGNTGSMVISPNPAANWVNVTAMLKSGVDIGQATVKIYHADGRLLLTQMVANAANFQLDVSNMPAGVYRLSLQSGAGRLEGSFSKQ